MKVLERDLGTPKFLAEGGFGKVYWTDYLLPSDPTPLAYKQFTIEVAMQARSAQTAVTFRTGLSPADRAELDEFCAWPREVVRNGVGKICGLLMPLIPPEFFCRQADPDTGMLTSRPRKMAWLISSAEQRAAAQVDLGAVERTDRLVLLAQLAYAIGRLHKHGWVFGDLSFNNASFALDPPRLMLLDCDGSAPLSDLTRQQSSTTFWDPPECPIKPRPGQPRQQELLDDRTDVYKLGLAVLRCLTPGKGAVSSRAISRLGSELDAEGTGLVAQAVSADRSDRPTAKEIYVYLVKVISGRVVAPEIVMAQLATPFCVRGMDARVEWQIGKADEIRILAGNGQVVTVDPAAHPVSYAFRPSDSGPVCVEALNRYGSVIAELGDLNLYELPRFEVKVALPRPQVPLLRAFRPPSLEATFSGRPRMAVGNHVLEIPQVGIGKFVESLVPFDRQAVTWPRAGEVITETSHVITMAILDEGGKFGDELRRMHAERINAGLPGADREN